MKKGFITITNKLYGGRTVSAYLKDGVAVAKVGKVWGVFHVASNAEISHLLQRKTLKEVKAVAQSILDLDVDWTSTKGDRVFDQQFRSAVSAIREIAKETNR
jgi:hypothetical protein